PGSCVPADEVVIGRIIPTTVVGLQGAAHEFIDLSADQEVLLPRPGIDHDGRLFLRVEGLLLMLGEFNHGRSLSPGSRPAVPAGRSRTTRGVRRSVVVTHILPDGTPPSRPSPCRAPRTRGRRRRSV